MYAAIDAKSQHESLKSYISKGFPDDVSFNKQRKMYSYGNSLYGGLLRPLKRTYYPYYKDSKRRKRTHKKGSTSKLGIRVDDEITMIVAGKPPKKFHAMTDAVMKQINEMGHVLQCAQLPVYVKEFKKITQADFITLDPSTNRLHMWELKTGFTPGMYTTRGKGHFSKELSGVKCTKYGIWELQRYWTHRSLQEAGLEVAASNVIQVYKDTKKKKFVVKVLDNLPWLKKLDKKRKRK